jgi:hypothetical protein
MRENLSSLEIIANRKVKSDPVLAKTVDDVIEVYFNDAL